VSPTLSVLLGSALGGVSRFLLSGAIQSRAGTWPWGTLTVNLLGSFVLGALYKYASMQPGLSPELRLFIGAGFCGGFTTFSTFSVEALDLLQQGDVLRFSTYVAASVLLGLAAALAGVVVVRTLLEG
jgi:CrcB protein